MTEEEAKSVNNQEVAAPEANSESQAQKQDESSKEMNFARLREKAEASDRKSQELERQLKEIAAKLAERERPPEQPKDELENLSPDDIVTVQQAIKLSEARARKIVDETLAERERKSLPSKTKAQFNDFDVVMTKENIEKFEQAEPELADACVKSSNPWAASYKLIKKFIMTDDNKKVNDSRKILKENEDKPLSSQSVGYSTPLSQANLWAEKSKEDVYREMMQKAGRL
jgi:hypothetical protein